MNTENANTLEQRIEHLERELRRYRHGALLVMVTTVFVVVGAVGAGAYAQSGCAMTNNVLCIFNPGEPASAAAVNHNFDTLVARDGVQDAWINSKVGSASTNVLLGSGKLVRGSNSVGTTDEAGIYSQATGDGIRLVTNNAPIGFYTDGGTGGRGSTVQMSVGTTGDVSVRGNLTATGNRWASGPTVNNTNIVPASQESSPNWSSADCNDGEFVCGLQAAHQTNNVEYWTGLRLRILCCQL